MTIDKDRKRQAILLFLLGIMSILSVNGQMQHGDVAEKLIKDLHLAPFKVILSNGKEAPTNDIKLQRIWNGDVCRFSLTNISRSPLSIREVIVFDFQHGLSDTTSVYGESFQKLGQVGGSLGNPADLGSYTDRLHYKIPEPEGMRTAYGMLTLQLSTSERVLLGFTSCKKFISRFSFDARRLRISLDCENLSLTPGQTWKLEEFIAITSPDREKLYDRLTAAINVHHPRLRHDPVPTGWCSWYCFGPNVTAQNVYDNTEWIKKNLPALKYIQIDDGYQPLMGDWLEQGKAFGGKVENVLAEIRKKKLEPAIWVAPFIASPQSKILKEHPDWFVKDENGKPVASDKIGFGGWRQGPWYVLDGTHPEVQQHLTALFRTMREKWGCTYFKLDANYWGAIHGGVHYDKNATRIEAYRRGMAAILKGAGDAFIVGCNHPVWPSLGLIHGSRSSMDVQRKWEWFSKIGKENLLRGWQNGRLWWNDPDCLLLNDNNSKDIMDPVGNPVSSEKVTENEYLFHAATIYASGGMLLSGDDLTKMLPHRLEILKKLLPPTGVAARFENENFEVGVTGLKKYKVFTVFNWGDKPVQRRIILPPGKFRLTDKWTGEDLGVHTNEFIIESLPGRSARIVEAHKVVN